MPVYCADSSEPIRRVEGDSPRGDLLVTSGRFNRFTRRLPPAIISRAPPIAAGSAHPPPRPLPKVPPDDQTIYRRYRLSPGAVEGFGEMRAIEGLVDGLLAAGQMSGYRRVDEPPLWSTARPWSHRLRLTTFQAVGVNQDLGVRYFPLPELARLTEAQPLLTTAARVLSELSARGAVAAQLPAPSWAICVCAGFDPAELTWLTPLPPAVR